MYKCCDCEKEFVAANSEYIEDDYIPYVIEACPYCDSEHFKFILSSE